MGRNENSLGEGEGILFYDNIIVKILDIIHRCLLFKTQRFGDWVLSSSSGGTYSFGPNK
jgi:hypothetical protein